MKLHEKLFKLRKENGMTQDDLAEKLDISRQAISRWEMGTALPDVINILHLSKLYGVSTDYLLNDEYESDSDLPIVKQTKQVAQDENNRRFTFFTYTASAAFVFLGNLYTTIAVSNIALLISIIASILLLVFYELMEYQQDNRSGKAYHDSVKYRKRYYILWSWVFGYFPLRYIALLIADSVTLSFTAEIVVAALYVLLSLVATGIILDSFDRKK